METLVGKLKGGLFVLLYYPFVKETWLHLSMTVHIGKEELVPTFDPTVESFQELNTVCFIKIFGTYLDL